MTREDGAPPDPTLADRKASLVVFADRLLRKIEKRARAIQQDIARAEGWSRLREEGSLLLQNLRIIRRGANHVELTDYSSGFPTEREITLDPSKTARENADHRFRDAQRFERGIVVARERLEQTQLEFARVDAMRDAIREVEDFDALDALEDRFAEASRSGSRKARPPVSAGARKQHEQRAPHFAFRIRDHDVFVGRSAKDNDELTLHIARPWDIWMHARGCPGSHVVIRLTKNEVCANELLLDAAHLAAHFSEARTQTFVEVTYAQKRYVRKPRKSPPGAVVVQNEKVLGLRIDEARTDNLLAHSRAAAIAP